MTTGQASYSQRPESKSAHSRVLVGLSGGIFSAVTAALLKTQGHELAAVYLNANLPDQLSRANNHCLGSGGNTRSSAEKVAAKLGVDLHVVDVSDLYRVKVLEEIVHATSRGRTPHPCLPCNREVRLAMLFKKAKELRCDRVATGHGAQVLSDPRSGLFHLCKATDAQRDQSFFLFNLSQSELQQLMLPLGNFPKAMVNRLGTEHGFDLTSVDAQSFCYSGASSTKAFLEASTAPSLRPRGVIRTLDDHVLGEHRGLYHYRIGDPVKLDHVTRDTDGLVVVEINMATQTLVLGPPDALKKKECVAIRTTWLGPMNKLKGLRCQARLSPNGEFYPCRVTLYENQTVHTEFDDKQGPLFPGQPIVFYQENEVLGGGWIRSTS
jgi:tRNA-specific 2-thiouridylase